MVSASELAIRRLRYRISRQGMLELDAWLARLLQADLQDVAVADAIDALLQLEAPELQAMMLRQRALPAALRRWL